MSPGKTIFVPYTVFGEASSPDDHNLTSGTLTFEAGSTTATKSFQLVNNSTIQSARRIQIDLESSNDVFPGDNSSLNFAKYDDDSSASALPEISSIGTGGQNSHHCVIINGGLYCWGHNAYGQIGDGTTTTRTTPTQTFAQGSGVTAVSLGGSHTCAIINGGLKCWGYNAYGQIGNGTNTNRSTPTQIFAAGSGITTLTAAGLSYTTCVTFATGPAQCWGDNSYNQLGLRGRYTVLSPLISVFALPQSTPATTPTSLALVTPSSSPANNATPTILVSGVISGSTVSLYTDSTCSSSSLQASGTASGTTIQLTTSALAQGTYTFYAKSTTFWTSSNCSSASLTYTYDPLAP